MAAPIAILRAVGRLRVSASPLGAWRAAGAVAAPLGAPSILASWGPTPARAVDCPSALGGDAAVEEPCGSGSWGDIVGGTGGLGWGVDGRGLEWEGGAAAPPSPLEAMNRNAREPRKANHGARPCSSVRRRRKYKTRCNDHPFIPQSKQQRKKTMDY